MKVRFYDEKNDPFEVIIRLLEFMDFEINCKGFNLAQGYGSVQSQLIYAYFWLNNELLQSNAPSWSVSRHCWRRPLGHPSYESEYRSSSDEEEKLTDLPEKYMPHRIEHFQQLIKIWCLVSLRQAKAGVP